MAPVQTKAMEKEQILIKQTYYTTVQVQDYVSFIPDLLEYLKNKVSNFQAGRLSSYVEQWKLLTSEDFRYGDRGTHRTLVNPLSG